MILKGSQRSGGLKLAAHLLNTVENDHVAVHELRGFMAADLRRALQEVEAVAKGTRCRQPLFSLSFNPPETERVTVEQFTAAIDRTEEKLGLGNQARAIIFHEKEGRRHAHVVWSRIDVEKMKAINLPFYKTRLNEVSKELFLEHGWRLPDGYRNKTKRNPLNFTLDQWQQAKRTKQDPQALKLILKECWSVSDNRASFEQALGDQGFILARGDRRGFVAVDYQGEVYSLSRWTDAKSKALSAKLGDPKDLPSAEEARARIAQRMTDTLQAFILDANERALVKSDEVQRRRTFLKDAQAAARKDMAERQAERAMLETQARAARFRSGVPAVWDWITGRTRKIRRENEADAERCQARDAAEREKLIAAQLADRRLLQQDLRKAKRESAAIMDELRCDVSRYLSLGNSINVDKKGVSIEINPALVSRVNLDR